MTSIVLWQSFDRKLVEQDGVFEFQKRPGSILWITLFCLLMTAIFFITGFKLSLLSGEYGALGWFLMGIGALIAVAGGCAFMGALCVFFCRNFRIYASIDKTNQTFTFGREILSLDQIRTFEILPFSRRFVSLAFVRTSGETKPLLTVASTKQSSLKLVADRFNSFLKGSAETLLPDQALSPSSLTSYRSVFISIVLIAMGVLWIAGGYFFFTGLYFTSRLERGGVEIPVWAMGFIPFLMGLYGLWRTRTKATENG